MVRIVAMTGLVCGKPGEIPDLLDVALLAAHGQDEGEGAERHDQIDQHIDGNARTPSWLLAAKPDQREADMAD